MAIDMVMAFIHVQNTVIGGDFDDLGMVYGTGFIPYSYVPVVEGRFEFFLNICFHRYN